MSARSASSSRLICAVAFTAGVIGLLLLAWLAYRPGLSGDFLLDDFANLPVIGATGPIDHWTTFWRYITSGEADPIGRPLTLLSFLIDARDWPASPYSFKLTNVLLHLLNGALLYAVLVRLGEALRLREIPARMAALLSAGAWLLHPLFVSTTLYIVQREAILPAMFTLIGILGWIAARSALARGHARRGLVGMLCAAWGCTLLAVLSKANGALLPLLLLLVEWIVLTPNQPMAPGEIRWRKRTIGILLVLPSVLLILWMLRSIPGDIRGAAQTRNWTLGQRMLTEPKVVADYLRLLFVPHVHSSGIFNDAFPVSTGWLHPWSTLPCIVLILGLIGTGFTLRKRQPAIALALLFYFSAQLLESTWLPLELYYEHRNYLPAMLLFWPIGIGLAAPGALRRARGIAALAVLALLTLFTFQRASLWGDGFRQALVWAALNPDSARAQTNAAQYDLTHDRPRLAAARLRNALSAHPHDLEIPVNLIGAECRLHALQPQTLDATRLAMANSHVGGTLGFNWFNEAIELAREHSCTGLDFAAVQSLLDAAHANPWWNLSLGRQQDLMHLQGLLDLGEQNPHAAMRAFNRALSFDPRPGVVLEQAAILGSRGYPELGLKHLDYFLTLSGSPKPDFGMPIIHAWILQHQHYWATEMTRLRATLQSDAADAAKQKSGYRVSPPTANG